jgi:ribonuclease Z
VILGGDTASSRSLVNLAKACKATHAYLPGVDRDINLRMVTRDAIIHGHSTLETAGLFFAKQVNAQRLLLNHFSARHKGDPSLDSMSIMTSFEQFSMAASLVD